MKTVFIPIFQGVEARNILRTDIYKILSQNKDLKIVLFISSEIKKEYFQKYFFGDNIVFEIFSEYKTPALNNLFSFLKYNLLKTKRMDVRRKIRLYENKNYIEYYFKLIFNRIFANKLFRQIVRFFDYYLVRDSNFQKIFDKYNPDLIFLAHLFGDIEVSMLREAKKRKIKTMGIINSWDKLTSRCIIRLLPDKLIVHNEFIKEEAIKHADMKSSNIQIVGVPHYDLFINEKPSNKDNFYNKMNININKKIILFCPMGKTLSDIDTKVLNIISNFQINGLISNNFQIIVRFPPNDIVDLNNIINKQILIFDQPGRRFSSKRGIDWDMDEKDNQHLLNSLFYSSLIICFASSLSIDAAIFNKPIINVDFNEYDSGYKNDNVNLLYLSDHYSNILKTNGIALVHNEKELLDAILKYLDNPEINQQGRKDITQKQCWKLDGKSGQRVADFILRYLNN